MKTQSWVRATQLVGHQLLKASLKLGFHFLLCIWGGLMALTAYWNLRRQKSMVIAVEWTYFSTWEVEKKDIGEGSTKLTPGAQLSWGGDSEPGRNSSTNEWGGRRSGRLLSPVSFSASPYLPTLWSGRQSLHSMAGCCCCSMEKSRVSVAGKESCKHGLYRLFWKFWNVWLCWCLPDPSAITVGQSLKCLGSA